MSFFKSLFRSLYDIMWLHEQRDKAKQAWIYFFLFTFLMTGLLMVPVFVEIFPKVGQLDQKLMENIPNFTAEIIGNKLKITELPQPYVIKDKNFILVIDTVTTTDLSVEQFFTDEIDSGLLLTDSKFESYRADRGQKRTQFFSQMGKGVTTDTGEGLKFNRDDVARLINRVLSLPVLIVGFILLFILVYVFTVAAKLVIFVIVTVIVLIINSIAKKEWSFEHLFNLALQSIALPTILVYAFKALNVNIPFGFTLLLTALILLVVYKGKSEENKAPTLPTV